MIVLYILLAIVVLLLMVLIHEFGHYVVGRALGFKITEFSVGFGKAIVQKTNKRGEKISLRIFPLGGYCAFYGEDSDDDKEDTNPDSFVNQKPWKRILVYIAGPLFNILSAIIFSFILLVSLGYGNIYRVSFVNPNFVSTASVIQEGDVIYEINDRKIDYVWDSTIETILSDIKEGDLIKIKFRDAETGEIVTETIVVETQQKVDPKTGEPVIENGVPIYQTGLGLSLQLSSERLSFLDALAQCIPFTIGLVWMVLKSLWLLITFQLPLSAIGGPITTVTTVANTLGQSFASILLFLPLIAANLGVFNILPFPALDGAHVVFTTIEWIRKKPIKRSIETWIHFIGLIILFAFVIIIDIIHFFV